MSENFNRFFQDCVKNPQLRFEGKLLALDPGETTGASIFECRNGQVELQRYWQINCMPVERGVEELEKAIKEGQPTRIVYEDYKIYGWKSAQHSWSALNTPKLIGSIELIARQNKIPITHELAQQPKGFCTDDKLNEWGFYPKGLKHARDSIRHGTFFLLFRYPTLVKVNKT